jgi:hypothetical protein
MGARGRKPGTPNAATRDVRALASVHGQAAIETLAAIMNSPTTPEAARIAAARELAAACEAAGNALQGQGFQHRLH